MAAIVSAYHDGGSIIHKIKVRRAEKRAPAPSRLLEDSIESAPQDIQREKERGISRFGQAFEEGDRIAVLALQSITIKLQSGLLQELKNATFDDEFKDFRWLVDVADSGRDQTMDTLIQLRQRLLTAEPIAEISPITSQAVAPPIVQTTAAPSTPQELAGKSDQARQDPRHLPARWSRDWNGNSRDVSRDASGEDDTVSGAESSHRKRHASILGFLKHHNRSHSHSDKHADASQRPGQEDPRRTSGIQSSTSIPLGAPSSTESTPSFGAPSDKSSTQKAQWKYQDWEDDPSEIWGAPEDRPSEHHDSVASVDTVRPASPTSPGSRMTSYSSNQTGFFRSSSSIIVPNPTHDNDFLGFCKGAARLQNGDKKALEKRKQLNEGWSHHSHAQYLACCSNKCAFAGHIDINVIMTKVWADEAKGLKFRWPFLAKSHVAQTKARNQQFSYQCTFCVYSGEKSPVFHGTDFYLEHVQKHRGYIGEVVLYKARCVNDRVCDDSEDFDINLFPLSADETRARKASEVLADELKCINLQFEGPDSKQATSGANKPWNEGLSNFHYGDELDRKAFS